MLRIDLLPAYVAQRRLTRQLVVLFTVIFTVIVLGMLAIEAPLTKQVSDMEAKAVAAEAFKAQVDTLTTQTSNVTALAPPYETKLKFVTDVATHNLAYPKLYREVAKYTVPSILYSSMSVSGTALSITAYTPKLADLADYLAHIWNDPDLKAVSVSAFPGYRQEYTPSKVDYTLPQLPPGYTAHFAGSSKKVVTFTVTNGLVSAISSGDETGTQPEDTSDSVKPKFDAAHSGFDFTVSAVLKSAIPEPTDPTGGTGKTS